MKSYGTVPGSHSGMMGASTRKFARAPQGDFLSQRLRDEGTAISSVHRADITNRKLAEEQFGGMSRVTPSTKIVALQRHS
jgi:hypothetical protein